MVVFVFTNACSPETVASQTAVKLQPEALTSSKRLANY